MLSDILKLFLLLLIIVCSVVVSEYTARNDLLKIEISRKILHIITSLIAAVSPVLISNHDLLFISGSAILIITFIAVKSNLFVNIVTIKRKNWGIVFLALSYTILLFLFPGGNSWIVTLSLLILAFADSAAALIGNNFAKAFFNLTTDRKSYLGSFVFYTVTLFIVNLFYLFYLKDSLLIDYYHFLLFSLMLALILTFFEVISSFGFDNFSVPIISALLLYIFIYQGDRNLIYNFLFGMILAGLVALISYKIKFLTTSGSVSTFLLAGFIFGFGGIKWSAPILSFFILSSILSKIRKKKNEEVELYFEKTGVRDYMQVIANGGIGGVLILINQIRPSEIFYLMYVASLAAACADTWATELGTLKKTPTYNILNLQPIEQGTSGGISIIGTIGGLLGALVIAISGIFWIETDLLSYVLLIILAGIIGSLFDSYLGATIQIQYKCYECSKITEREIHCGENTTMYRGINWINNDVVNIFSGLAGVLIIFLIKGM